MNEEGGGGGWGSVDMGDSKDVLERIATIGFSEK